MDDIDRLYRSADGVAIAKAVRSGAVSAPEIAEAAIRSRCAVLFSEDFAHGRTIAGVQILNPLRD